MLFGSNITICWLHLHVIFPTQLMCTEVDESQEGWRNYLTELIISTSHLNFVVVLSGIAGHVLYEYEYERNMCYVVCFKNTLNCRCYKYKDNITLGLRDSGIILTESTLMIYAKCYCALWLVLENYLLQVTTCLVEKLMLCTW